MLAERVDGFAELRSPDSNPGEQDKANSTSPTLRKRASQRSISPPSSPRMARRRSSLLQRRSSIINDLDIGATASHDTMAVRNHKMDTTNVNGLESQALDAQRRSDSNTDQVSLTGEPLNIIGSNHGDEKSSAKAELSKPEKKQGISIFKSAAASNSQQGAQEFDFSSFGF